VEEKLAELKRRLGEVSDLRSAAAVLDWDQMVNMPPA
jgi:Zn-dependent M32 family carboxypeptidase